MNYNKAELCKDCKMPEKPVEKKRDIHLTDKHQGAVMKAMSKLGNLDSTLKQLRGNVKNGYAALEGKDEAIALASLNQVIQLKDSAHEKLIEYYKFLDKVKRRRGR